MNKLFILGVILNLVSCVPASTPTLTHIPTSTPSINLHTYDLNEFLPTNFMKALFEEGWEEMDDLPSFREIPELCGINCAEIVLYHKLTYISAQISVFDDQEDANNSIISQGSGLVTEMGFQETLVIKSEYEFELPEHVWHGKHISNERDLIQLFLITQKGPVVVRVHILDFLNGISEGAKDSYIEVSTEEWIFIQALLSEELWILLDGFRPDTEP